ncbi:3-oxoacyl-[acyl-carrier-protein] synthase III C-terminal domain-containing protein [Nonomuraea sp. NPDC049607]|uniref:3-oxoacyl-[acyl-carrier-protein] synthase III C-terminal domain-containing protein n=1 Tax=Nonomuraea sp. NPDC049607 TaxID=3154732 RepID=UPI0034447535
MIESLGVYLPSRVLSTQEVLDGCRTPLRFPLERFTGIRSRRAVEDGQYSIDLAIEATSRCLARSARDPAEIGLLICCNISRLDGPMTFSYEPSTSAKLRERFGLRQALSFDVTNGCAGMFTAIAVVDAFLKAGVIDSGLVVSGEHITHLTRTAQLEIDGFMDPRMACLTLGDAGAALLLGRSTDGNSGFHALDLYTLGRYGEYCLAHATDREHGGAIMHTDSLRLHAVTVNEAILHAMDVLAGLGARPDACQHLIMHQTSEKTLSDAVTEINRRYRRTVCHPGNVVYNLAERGNTATTSHFIALHDKASSGRVRTGDNVLFSVTGSGLTVGTAVYTLDDLPDRLRDPGAPPRPSGAPAPAPSATRRPRRRVRIESVGMSPDGGSADRRALELARLAADECLRESGYHRSRIELLLYAGVYREQYLSEPALAALVAGALEINDSVESDRARRTFAFDVCNGSLGFLNACHVAATMIEAGKAETAMVLAAEIENNLEVRPDALLGVREVASALILDAASDGHTGFGQFLFRAHPQHLAARTIEARHHGGRSYLHIHQDGDLEDHYLSGLTEVTEEVLDRDGVKADELCAVLAPQRSPEFLRRLAEALDVSPERVVNTCADGLDLYTSSLPYGFRGARERGLARPGDVGLVLGAGAGVQVGGALYWF